MAAAIVTSYAILPFFFFLGPNHFYISFHGVIFPNRLFAFEPSQGFT